MILEIENFFFPVRRIYFREVQFLNKLLVSFPLSWYPYYDVHIQSQRPSVFFCPTCLSNGDPALQHTVVDGIKES
jgi:hypothetical protein